MPLKKAPSLSDAVEQHHPAPIPVAVAALTQAARAVPQDAKGRQISRQGLFQAALQSPALMQFTPDIDTYLALVKRVAEAGLAFVNE